MHCMQDLDLQDKSEGSEPLVKMHHMECGFHLLPSVTHFKDIKLMG